MGVVPNLQDNTEPVEPGGLVAINWFQLIPINTKTSRELASTLWCGKILLQSSPPCTTLAGTSGRISPRSPQAGAWSRHSAGQFCPARQPWGGREQNPPRCLEAVLTVQGNKQKHRRTNKDKTNFSQFQSLGYFFFYLIQRFLTWGLWLGFRVLQTSWNCMQSFMHRCIFGEKICSSH